MKSALTAASVTAAAVLLVAADDVTPGDPIARNAKPGATCAGPLPTGRAPSPITKAPHRSGHPSRATDRGGDFNGDGRRDTAVAVPFRTTETPDSTLRGTWSGAYVAVVHSGPQGPDPSRRQIITHDCLDVPTRDKPNYVFGTTLGSADFDHDGYDDLVVGGLDGGFNGQGRSIVAIVYGSANGLTSRTVELVSDTVRGYFSNLAIGDFGGNGELDIVATTSSREDLYFFRNVVDRPVAAERSGPVKRPPHGRGAEDSFQSLQVADFNADGRSDLVVMAHWMTQGEKDEKWGELRLGGPKGLSDRATVFGRDRIGLRSMAGDVTGDGRPDLVMGDDFRTEKRTMFVAPGTSTGLGAPRAFTIPIEVASRDRSPDQAASLEAAPGFTVGDVTGDRIAEVTVAAAGKIAILPGGRGGVRPGEATIITRDDLPQGPPRWIGDGLSTGDLTGDGKPELTVGAPEWSTRAGGRVYLLPGGRPRGATTISGAQLGLTQRPNGGFGQILLP
ncbi:FG-GAP repeat protein [Spirillospora sp. NPDC029432]|uniref:FG-GAP repeat protein n=1 Tax=Spirillospora sp. NPDC029432 TaxID=3154599 RepID=UPI0034540C3D